MISAAVNPGVRFFSFLLVAFVALGAQQMSWRCSGPIDPTQWVKSMVVLLVVVIGPGFLSRDTEQQSRRYFLGLRKLARLPEDLKKQNAAERKRREKEDGGKAEFLDEEDLRAREKREGAAVYGKKNCPHQRIQTSR